MGKYKYIIEFKEEDLKPTDSFIIKDDLNPEVWDDFKMKKDIRERLLEISNEFLDSLYGDFTVYDIILVGSLSSYNWSKYSDFDLHIQIDYKDINDDIELVSNYLELFGKRFSKDYDITIYGYDVELYVEDKHNTDRSHINGIYSIMKDKWVKRPSPITDHEVDTELVENKAIVLMNMVDDLESDFDKMNYTDRKDEIDRVWGKIKKSRRDGINSPDGEFSIGNLVFKYLRRNEYISKVIELKKKLVEEKYTLE